MSRYLTTKGVAELLKVGPETVRLYARQGRIPFEVTPGGHRRYNEAAVLAAMAAEREGPLSVGPSKLSELRSTASAVNFEGELPAVGMATEVAALASQARLEPLPAPAGSNEVHAGLMRWAGPARLPIAH